MCMNIKIFIKMPDRDSESADINIEQIGLDRGTKKVDQDTLSSVCLRQENTRKKYFSNNI